MSNDSNRTDQLRFAPAILAALLLGLSLTDRVQDSLVVVRSFQSAAGLLVVWNALLLLWRRSAGGLQSEVRLRKQHYIQAMAQVAVFAYWGWYWRPVYDMAILIGAQLVFAYAFSALIAWTRGRTWTVGFGPFPIIFSINLFLWFRDDWFYLQFLMIAVGFLGKEFIRWSRDGRRVHIFNPSAFALGLFSLGLIATGTTDLTWGREIASTLTLAPAIYTWLFAVGLVVMYFFSITLVAGVAATVLFAASALVYAITGVPFFVDSEIPAAVFLGLHLLITDPSTSPRTPMGKAVFGGLYGVGVFVLYAVLGNAGVPTFYDKLLCVPLLNLSVRGIDHLVHTWAAKGVDVLGLISSAGDAPRLRRLNLTHMAVWIGFFGLMSLAGKTDATHPGDRIPFWQAACDEGRWNACDRLIQIETTYCGDNSAWACNEVGLHYATGVGGTTDTELAGRYLEKACDLRFQPACLNLLEPAGTLRADPKPLDLRLLLREAGLNLLEASDDELLQRACAHEWAFACEAVGQ